MNLTAKENNFLNEKEEGIAYSANFLKESFYWAPRREDELWNAGPREGDLVSSRATTTKDTQGTGEGTWCPVQSFGTDLQDGLRLPPVWK